MTQLASPFSVSTATMDGNAPSKVQSVSIGTDGTLSYVYANGKTVPAYSIPLGNVISPDNLTNITGDVFQVSSRVWQPRYRNRGDWCFRNHSILRA